MKGKGMMWGAVAAAALVSGPAMADGYDGYYVHGEVGVHVYDSKGGYDYHSFTVEPPITGYTPTPDSGIDDDFGPVHRGEETFEEYMNRKYPHSSSARVNACAQEYLDNGKWCGRD